MATPIPEASRPTTEAPNGALLWLLRLASPALPVGAYSYSQGLEWAIQARWVTDGASLVAWIIDHLTLVQGRFDLPLLSAAHDAWARGDSACVRRLNALYLTTRETRESRDETLQTGYSLAALARGVSDFAGLMLDEHPWTYPVVLAGLASRVSIAPFALLTAHAFAWAENQVTVAIKALPLGQMAGQRVLSRIAPEIGKVCVQAMGLAESEWQSGMPGLAIASSLHETQYTRLFRS